MGESISSPAQERPKVILLVEDNAIIREYALLCLEDQGCTVHCAGSGEQALGMLDSLQGQVDLLIADLSLPGMSGLDLASQARHGNPELRVLFVSGSDVDNASDRPASSGFLQKPYTPDALAQAVLRMTAAHPGLSESHRCA
jgi:CheY-like chemotaxis protein